MIGLPLLLGLAGEGQTTILPVPTLDHTPETGLSGGAVVMVGHAFPDSRRSTASLEGTVTAHHQRILTLDWAVFGVQDRLYTIGSAALLRYPERYWGIGPYTRPEDGEDYDALRRELRPAALWRIASDLYGGPSLVFQSVTDLEAAPGGQLVADPGGQGGQSLGLGLALAVETRADTASPRAGERALLVEGQGFGPGSDLDFRRLRADGRAYLGLPHEAVLAVQGVTELHGGQPPFRMLSLLGGDSLLRGTYLGRFRDRQLLAGQVELRAPIVWRIGLVGFVGAGAVADRPGALFLGPWVPSLGGGLRITVDADSGTNLRVDGAWGGDGGAVYVGFGEAF